MTTRPHGRDEIRAAAIAATHRLLQRVGPVRLTMRAVAAEANVNPGLLHRHFGSRAELLRAAADDLRARSEQRMSSVPDLDHAVDVLLGPNQPWFARGLAWAILQDELDVVLPDTFPAMQRLVELVDEDRERSEEERTVVVAALMSLALGWRLYEPYIARSLGVADDGEHVEHGLRELMRRLAHLELPAPESPRRGG